MSKMSKSNFSKLTGRAGAVTAFVLLSLSGCVSMPESERELEAGRLEAEKYAGMDSSQFKLRSPDNDMSEAKSLPDVYRELDFNPNGRTLYAVALSDPVGTHYARILKNEAVARVAALFPNKDPVDNEADAFRHAYFSFRLADKIGSERAKRFTDSYEISNINTMGARCMDLFNNREGRRMCEESKSDKASDRRALAEKTVLEAIVKRRLVLEPYRLLAR